LTILYLNFEVIRIDWLEKTSEFSHPIFTRHGNNTQPSVFDPHTMSIVGAVPMRIPLRLKSRVRQFASTSGTGVRRTALYDVHVKEGATMVEYGGFQMPILYKSQSISDSVIWTRTKASLFDVFLISRGTNYRLDICNKTG
jgi:hypothetical protein